jgi:hypothetical protein
MSQTSAIDMGEAVEKMHFRSSKMKFTGTLAQQSAYPNREAKEHSRFIALTLLIFLLPFGLLSMHVLMHRNGYYASMVHLRDYGPHLLPGTQEPLVRKYTGNSFLDYWLTVLVCFFANAVDGSELELSAFCMVFAANMGPCLVLVYVESFRGRSWGWAWL